MELVSLLYISRVSDNFSGKSVDEIQEIANKENPKRFITGFLCFNNKFFVQVIEGPSNHVNQLYQNICKDSRHHEITIMEYKRITQRNFFNWSMGFFLGTALKRNMLLKYGATDQFDPYNMASESLYQLLKDLRDNTSFEEL